MSLSFYNDNYMIIHHYHYHYKMYNYEVLKTETDACCFFYKKLTLVVFYKKLTLAIFYKRQAVWKFDKKVDYSHRNSSELLSTRAFLVKNICNGAHGIYVQNSLNQIFIPAF